MLYVLGASAGAKQSALLEFLQFLCDGTTGQRPLCQFTMLQAYEEIKNEANARLTGGKRPVNDDGTFAGSRIFGGWLGRREGVWCRFSTVEHLMSHSQPKLIAYQP